MAVTRTWAPPAEFEEYRLMQPLGRGAMGQVFLARDTLLDRAVAIKFIAEIEPGSVARERFLIEARAIARLQHPNVVSVYRVGELDGRPFIVSEFVRGTRLDFLERPVAASRVQSIAIGLARGLAAAHRRGVLHRDIKPENAMVSDDGEVKLLDFGLAKLTDALPGALVESPAHDQSPPLAATAQLDTSDMRLLASDATCMDSARTIASSPPVQDEAIAAGLGATKLGTASGANLTQVGAIMGTPLFMAPEIWKGQPATPRSDVYSVGALLYQLVSGRVPHHAESITSLATVAVTTDCVPLAELVDHVDNAFAAVVDRCLRRDPAKRYADGDELREAFERLTVEAAHEAMPEGNPYPGLRAFGSEHKGAFFGRGADVRAVLERLRTEPFVLVAGDSGVGKSSLCRAGVIPRIEAGALSARVRWTAAAVVPGRRPLTALAGALKDALGIEEQWLLARVPDDLSGVSSEVRRRLGADKGLLLFVDQLEELATMSDGGDASTFTEVLRVLSVASANVRVLATVRGDFLTRLASLPGIGEDVTRTLFLLKAMTRDGLREAIAGPARAKDTSFESKELVDALVDEAERADGALPLLQFTLAALWEARDRERSVITQSSLAAMGGVAGALASHADGVVEAMLPPQRAEARKIFSKLVTTGGTRARLGEDELCGAGESEAVLQALVRGRLLVARATDEGTTYEIAHEALIAHWDTLRNWIAGDAEARAALERVRAAAREWHRLGRTREALWSERQLVDLEGIAAEELARREQAFVSAARASIRGRKLRRWAFVVGVPLLIAAIYAGVKLKQRADIAAGVDRHLSNGRQLLRTADEDRARAATARNEAFRAFDAAETEAEASWTHALDGARQADHVYAQAAREIEMGLILDPRRDDVRNVLAQILYQRAVLAEESHDQEKLDELMQRLALYDDGRYARAWSEPAILTLAVPATARLRVYVYRSENGYRTATPVPHDSAGPRRVLELPPDSYLLELEADDAAHSAVRYPIMLERGERREVDLTVPARGDIPDGFVYIPAGRFWIGSGDEAMRTGFFSTVPLHTRTTGAYLIARHETTYADWIEFLDALPDDERMTHVPRIRGSSAHGTLDLSRGSEGGWTLTLAPTVKTYVAEQGSPLTYAERSQRAAQDWTRFPVTGISTDDATAYTAWLRASGRVPGARLCSELEWVRAARGADTREFPHGDTLGPDDANFDETYGRKSEAFGPDEVGSYPRSTSPFGIEDLTGNAFEWTTGALTNAAFVIRGGAYYFGAVTGRIPNRWVVEPGARDLTAGLRVCADPPHR